MIATGQLFEPYLYHPDADVHERRQESDYCLQRLEEWIAMFKWDKDPKNIEMDWEGNWLDPNFVKNWDRNYVIPDVVLETKPEYHPPRYQVQPNAIRMILPAKGMLPMGSYLGSPGFGLIHPTTITAAVLQDAGFLYEPDNSQNPMRFDTISLAPNFDVPTGRNRMADIVSLITQWSLYEPPEEDSLVCIPPEDLSFTDFINLRYVPVVQRESWDREVHRNAFRTATQYSEDQLLAHHMTPMLGHMGTYVRAILYQHALSRAGLDTTPLRDVLTKLAPIINQVIEHAWLSKVDFDQIKEHVGDYPALAEKYPVRRFRQLLWDVIGCETVLGEWQQFTSEEQRLIVYASFYGLPAPDKVPYQKGYGLLVEDHEVIPTDIDFEYHSQYIGESSYKLSTEEGESEPAISPPPPTEPELEDPIVFDPKVTGIWDHLLGLMTDEQKAQLKEQAKTEEVSPSYRHVDVAEIVPSTSRSNPVYFGRIAIAANRGTACPRFNELMNVILPCSEKEAVAVFSSPPWAHRLIACTTHEEVINVFRLYHEQCWSEVEDGTTDPAFWTAHGNERYKKIRRRLKFLDRYVSKYKYYPMDYGEDNFSSADEPINVNQPPPEKFRAVVPGDFVLTFGVLVLANSLESNFPHRSEYWWSQLEGTLDQACMCFSMQQWVDQLKTCEDEEIINQLRRK